MVKLRQDSKGTYSARKRLPDEVREQYARLYGARLEAKFSAPARIGSDAAKQKFREWEAEVVSRIENIRRTQRGDGIDLNHRDAQALAGEWYRWFVARHEDEPGDPGQWDRAFWRLVEEMQELLPDGVQKGELGRSDHDLREWTAHPEVREGMRPIISDFGLTAQFLASKSIALSNAGRDNYLDAVLDNCISAVLLLERRAVGDYSQDPLPNSFPKFVPRDQAKTETGQKPSELFEAWVNARQPAHGTVESWSTVFNALTRAFPERSASAITPDEAQKWMDGLVTEDRSASTVRNTWLRATKTVYNWARKRKLSNNPFAEVMVDVPRRKQTRPKHFYEHERLAILNAANAITDTGSPDKAARRWVPWLLSYTGARPAEITQLRDSDVQFVENVWSVNLTPEAGTIKGGVARRVPLHAHLIEQGFLDFVQARGDGPLFYRPRKQRGNNAATTKRKKSPAAQVRQRLAGWVRQLGVNDDHLSPNHAWRHTFQLIADRAGIPEKISDAITGHAPASVGRTYGAPTVADMAQEINKFPRYVTGSNVKPASGRRKYAERIIGPQPCHMSPHGPKRHLVWCSDLVAKGGEADIALAHQTRFWEYVPEITRPSCG
jgi:integrase